MPDHVIATAAEALEAEALPRLREVHAGEDRPADAVLPPALRRPADAKTPARWAYERLILYIQRFEQALDADQEVAMAMTGGHSGVLRIEGMGYFDPDIVTFYGTDPSGAKTQLIQHVTQLSVILRALPRQRPEEPAERIGFRLARELEETEEEDDAAAQRGPDAAGETS
ncbi:DUF6173 family protein [Limimaricola pyoseonensis]|uniref:Uncharacterized protein n=1 Tax=Limimaricola pyoseonensis TaxID=521013 RepID=A0A1G7JZB2_9RHOB|nr:DUF6173 family protein [Limimaricola pyoseonensis]SDF30155.1 hypothetical protein SAMN04488567_0058 [Limimaricola pyoseonensis]